MDQPNDHRDSTILPARSNGALPTCFAPAERSTAGELGAEVRFATEDPVVDTLLTSISGLIAVLNERRQVLAVNDQLLRVLGLGEATRALGLRLGEAVGCVHSDRTPGGCGTSEYCATCGAVVAQMASLAQDHAIEKVCAIDLRRPINGSDQLYLRVQACPVRRSGQRLLLMFLQDISESQQRAALDRTFFHDVNNTLSAVLTAADALAQDARGPEAPIAEALVHAARRLAREIELQRCLAGSTMDKFEANWALVRADTLVADMAETCEHHPECFGRTLRILPIPEVWLETDSTVFMRVLQNMIINALEATPPGGEVRLWTETTTDAIDFCVWNFTVIPPDVARRVFQRNYSTKGTIGRGLGTYSMKLLGERLLHGAVSFTSTPESGTCFRIRLRLPGAVMHGSPR